jgi:hypothetical protein
MGREIGLDRRGSDGLTRRLSLTCSDKLTSERLAKMVSDLEVELRQRD